MKQKNITNLDQLVEKEYGARGTKKREIEPFASGW